MQCTFAGTEDTKRKRGNPEPSREMAFVAFPKVAVTGGERTDRTRYRRRYSGELERNKTTATDLERGKKTKVALKGEE